jgi:hypothetical protein
MRNLLADATLWHDNNLISDSPPPEWNGSEYVFAANDTAILTLNTGLGGDYVYQNGDYIAGVATGIAGGFVSCVIGDAGGDSLSLQLLEGELFDFHPSSRITSIQISNSAGAAFTLTPEAPAPAPTADTANCDCDDTTGNKTLATLRRDLMVRLGFAAQADNPPPGMTDLLNSFLIEAQELLYRRYDVLRTERFYSWNLQAGVKFYDINANVETCTKRLDPRKVTWCGVHMDDTWYPLECGIPPELYSGSPNGWPQRYEVRQCIEVWPVPDQTSGTLVIKGHFGLEPFAADTDTTTIDDRLVFLLALANAKAHYGKPDANDYIAQMEQMMVNLVAGSHQTRRYIPGRPRMFDMVYTAPKPTVPFT